MSSPLRTSMSVAQRKAEEYVERENFQRKLTEFKQTHSDKDEIEQYQKTEILRKSINTVRQNANRQEALRLSPQKFYGKVKSKVAGNLKVQKKSKNSPSHPKNFNDIERVTLVEYKPSYAASSPKRDSPTHKLRASQIHDQETLLQTLAAELQSGSWRNRGSPSKSSLSFEQRSPAKREQVEQHAPTPAPVSPFKARNDNIPPQKIEAQVNVVVDSGSIVFEESRAQKQASKPKTLKTKAKTVNYVKANAQSPERQKSPLKKTSAPSSNRYNKAVQKSVMDMLLNGQSPNKARLQKGNESPSKRPATATVKMQTRKVQAVVNRPTYYAGNTADPEPVEQRKSTGVTMMKRNVKQSSMGPCTWQGNTQDDVEVVTNVQVAAQVVQKSPAKTNAAKSQNSPNRLSRLDLEDRSAKLQAEFEALLTNSPAKQSIVNGEQRDFTKDEFYQNMNEFYHGPDTKKWESPSKRMIYGDGQLINKFGVKGEHLSSSPERKKAASYVVGYKDPVKFLDKFLDHEDK